MSALHVRFWLLAGLGILLDGFDFFVIAVANPLIKRDFLVFSLLCTVAWSLWVLIVFRFVLGLAIGLDYPIAASYLAEVLPSKDRGRWLTAAFSLQAGGILLGATAGVVILEALPHLYAWRVMLGCGAIPATVIIFLRRGVPESPRWLAQNGREKDAQEVAERLCPVPVVVTPADTARAEPGYVIAARAGHGNAELAYHRQPRLRNPGVRRARQLLRALDQQHQIVRIAVRPVLAGLDGGDDRVPRQLRVRGRVPVW